MIPFHNLCFFQILPKVLGHANPKEKDWETLSEGYVDREVLYDCLAELIPSEDPAALHLDYYELQQAHKGQPWICERGKEVRQSIRCTRPS